MNPYSGQKALYHADRMLALSRGEQIVPTHVQLIISDLCNHDCHFCAYRMSGYTSNALFGEKRPDGTVNNNPNRMIPLAKSLEILDDCAAMGVRAIQFTGGGEPTVHHGHESIFAHALDLGLECALVSNGMRWSDHLIHEILPRFAWVRVSVDAGTPTTYANVRRVRETAFARVWRNISALAIEHNLRPDFRLGVGFVATNENWNEIVQCAEIAKDAEADNMRIGAMFSPQGEAYYADTWGAIREQCDRAKELEDAEFTVYDLFGQRLGDLRQHAPDYHACAFQQFTTYIGADLNVYRCCNTAYNPVGLIGSLKEQTLAQLWAGEQKRKAIAHFDPSQSCTLCQFNDKNRAILAALDNPPDLPPAPEHLSFV